MCQILSPIRLSVYKLQLFKWSYFANFQNNRKIWISCVDKVLLSDGKKYCSSKQWLNKCYSESALWDTLVKRCYADFKSSQRDTNDAKCSGHLNLAVVSEYTKKLHKLFLADCKMKLHEIAEELKVSEGSVLTFCMNIVNEKAVFSDYWLFTDLKRML